MDFWLAPLHGITNYHFRNCLNRHVDGISMAVTPFLPVQESAKLNVKKWGDIQPENNTAFPVIPQLIGNNPAHFVDTIRALQNYGYQRFNWNIGCPAAQVVRKRRGCGIMPFPDMVQEVVEKVLSQTACLFSIKMRLGMFKPDEAPAILQQLRPYPLDFIAVHPRLGVQQYEGLPDWNAFAELQKCSQPHFVYSGDIFDNQSFENIKKTFLKVDACMLGRGILRNIFLAEELRTGHKLPTEMRSTRFQAFYEDLTETLLTARGEHGTLSLLKELWHYFACFWEISAEDLQQLLRQNDYSSFHALAASYMLRTQNI